VYEEPLRPDAEVRPTAADDGMDTVLQLILPMPE